jgi:hypothetical protein
VAQDLGGLKDGEALAKLGFCSVPALIFLLVYFAYVTLREMTIAIARSINLTIKKP